MRAAAWTLLLVLFLGVAYVFSYGPCLRMHCHGNTLRWSKPAEIVYQPLEWLLDNTPLEKLLTPWHRWLDAESLVALQSASRQITNQIRLERSFQPHLYRPALPLQDRPAAGE